MDSLKLPFFESQCDVHQIAAEIKGRARTLGFDLVGISSAEPSQYRQYLRQWLDEGRAGEMQWLTRRFEERTEPSTYLPGAASVICVAINYHVPLKPLPEEEQSHHGRIARYALGEDYHELLKSRLHELADWLRQASPDIQTRCSVDTGPVMEKELAARAGIGWLGKNTCIINPRIGSWLLLGEILTTLPLPFDEPAVDRCGTCRRCIDACPTQAITAPYQLDARSCISYWTIEQRQPLTDEQQQSIGPWLYGCDICQEVCPWNCRATAALDERLQPRFPTGSIDLREVITWTSDDYARNLKNSAMKRVKLPVIQRNAASVLRNLPCENPSAHRT